MFFISRFKGLIILTLITILILVLGYQYFWGGGISLFGERKNYTEGNLIITDSTMGAVLAEDESLKELRGYYEDNKVERGDIVIVKLEGKAGFPRKVVAVPGDKIEFEEANLKVNEKVLENSEGKPFPFPDTIRTSLEGKVPEDSYLVISDQTSPSSFDSRQFGFISKEELQGKIIK